MERTPSIKAVGERLRGARGQLPDCTPVAWWAQWSAARPSSSSILVGDGQHGLFVSDVVLSAGQHYRRRSVAVWLASERSGVRRGNDSSSERSGVAVAASGAATSDTSPERSGIRRGWHRSVAACGVAGNDSSSERNSVAARLASTARRSVTA
ncbi:hypothetical protein PRNP1_015177 [Phytophthora ramorum]